MVNHPLTYCSRFGKQLPDDSLYCPFCGTALQPAANVPTNLRRNGFDALRDGHAREYWFRRFIAFVIDAIIVEIAAILISTSVAFYSFLTGPLTLSQLLVSFQIGGLPSILRGMLLVVYFTLADSIYGRSLGKSIIDFRVVTDDGRLPNLDTSLVRNISKINWLLLLLDVVIGLALGVDYKKKPSDRYVRTLVVQK